MIPPHGCFMPTVYVVAGATLLLATSAGSAAPLPTRDQNPLLAGFGLPVPLPARFDEAGHWSVAADVNWASTALAQQRGAETLVFDAETQEVRLTFQHILSDRFAMRLQVPYRHTGGGSLDSVIDSFHDISGTSEGARPDLPPDQKIASSTAFTISPVPRKARDPTCLRTRSASSTRASAARS